MIDTTDNIIKKEKENLLPLFYNDGVIATFHSPYKNRNNGKNL